MTTKASKTTGTSGRMIIDVTNGNRVRFFLSCTNKSTHVSNVTWTGKNGGTNLSGKFSINGVQTVLLFEFEVASNRTVSFHIPDTNTSGLGGPTTVSTSIDVGVLNVKIGGDYKDTKPYLKVDGEYESLQVYVKNASGIYKLTI